MIIGISFALLRTLVSVLWHTPIAPRGAPAGSLMLGLRLKRGDAVAARGRRPPGLLVSVPAGRPPSTESRRRRKALGSSRSLAFPRRAVSSQLKLPFLQFRPSGNVEDHYRSRGIRHTARYLRAGSPLAHIECLIEADLRRARRP